MDKIVAKLKADWTMPLSSWLLFIWLMSSLFSFAVAFGVWFVPSALAEGILAGVGVILGVCIVVWSATNPLSRDKIHARSLPKRLTFFAFAPLIFGQISLGNIYMALYGLHMLTSQSAVTTYTVSMKGTGLDVPGRCSRYFLFAEVRFMYFKRACVSSEQYAQVARGSTVTVAGTRSPLGFLATNLVGLQANQSFQWTLRDKAAQRP